MSDRDVNSVGVFGNFLYEVEPVFKEYYAPLCYFASKFLPDAGEAEDIVQEVFTVLMEKKPAFRTEVHLKNFLYLSVRNACISHVRKDSSKERYIRYRINEESDETLEHAIITTEIYKELAEAVDKLPAECRKVFELCYFQGLDNETVAQKLELSVHTVKAQKARGKKILKENLKDLYLLFLVFYGIDHLL